MRCLSLLAVAALLHEGAGSTYPAYCAKDMNLNAIQPLEDPSSVELVQVQIVVRHGARTPCFADVCWKDYDEEWNCNEREITRPQLGNDIPSVEFTKVFTAGSNIRRGNCSLGQLIDEGYDQEIANAKHFRDAYVGRKSGLFGASEAIDLTNSSDIYLESSDIPRTLQSGQTIISALFPNLVKSKRPVPWRTQDVAVSSIFPNERICPSLAALGKEWTTSQELRTLQTNPASLELDLALDEQLVTYSSQSLYDCLMTSRCTNRDMPLSDELFHLVINREENLAIQQYLFRDSRYAKIGMKSFLQAVVARMQPNQPRLALYSAHDSSLMAILAALGGKAWLTEWVPFASHVVFELYRTKTSGHVVRVLYQGQPLLLGSCTSELCPVEELISIVDAMPSCLLEDPTNEFAKVKHVPMMLMLVTGIVVGGAVGFIVARRYFGVRKQQYHRLD
ncbi:hypothetical protein AC1031_008166 [Aphanomyces cochlioides]|nr:hypothetical protein AC1031_008166 [Aphanomyces cochlioides]